MSFRWKMFLGFAAILILGAAVSFFMVFRLSGQLTQVKGADSSRAIIEASLDRLHAQPTEAEAARIGRETILELSRLNARSQLAKRTLLLDSVAYFAGFLVVQVLALLALSVGLSASMTRPMRRLLTGIRQAGTAAAGFAMPALGGREWAEISQAFNDLLRTVDDKETQLAEQSRLSGWQEVAAFLSHQLKNPLTAIDLAITNLQTLGSTKACLPVPEQALLQAESLQIIQTEGQRLVELVRRFRSSTTLPSAEFQSLGVEDLLHGAVQRLDPSAFVLESRIPAGLTLRADRQLLEEALVNLFTNSLQARPDPDQPVTLRFAASQSAGVTRFEISDSITGLSPELAARILTVPFSTKAGGSGLGLVFVRSVLARHRGSLSVQLGAAGGLQFTLKIPGTTPGKEPPHGQNPAH